MRNRTKFGLFNHQWLSSLVHMCLMRKLMFSSPLIQQILAKLLPVSAHSKSLDFFLVIALGYLYDFFIYFGLQTRDPIAMHIIAWMSHSGLWDSTSVKNDGVSEYHPFSHIPSFTQQTFIEHLLYARCGSRCWGYSRDQGRQESLPWSRVHSGERNGQQMSKVHVFY